MTVAEFGEDRGGDALQAGFIEGQRHNRIWPVYVEKPSDAIVPPDDDVWPAMAGSQYEVIVNAHENGIGP